MKTNKILLTLITASVSAGTAHAQSKMYTKSSKVPAYKLVQQNKRVTNIPRLNIGKEKEVVANIKPLNITEAGQVNLSPLKRLPSPPLVQFPVNRDHILPAGNVKAVTNNKAIQNVPDLKILNDFGEPNFEIVAEKPELQPLEEMKPNDYKMLQALIFKENQKNHEMALGLFAELMEDPRYRNEAWYNYALTAKNLGLNSEFRMGMIKIATDSKTKEWQEKAVRKLV
jgi:hypothetical protein